MPNAKKPTAAEKVAADKVEETKVEETVVVEEGGTEDEVVEVKKSDLEGFLSRLKDLEDDNKKLLDVADKGRMHQINEAERSKMKLLPTVKITRMGGPTGKIVVAWVITRNESYVDGNRLVEKQEMEVFYEDGKSEKMPLISFYRKQNKDTVGTIQSRTKSEDGGEETLKLKLNTGGELEIDLKFVN